MAAPFNTWAFLAARGFLRNYAAYRQHQQHMRLWSKIFPGEKVEGEIDEEHRRIYGGAWGEMRRECAGLELVASVASIDRMLGYLREPHAQFERYWEMGEELEGRLLDELKNCTFLSLTLKETEFFEKPREGWEVVIARFPDSVGDIEEARKCFALSRYAAAIFHSVQIVEVGLIELGKVIGVTDPLSGWTATTQAIKRIIDTRHQDRTPYQRAHFAFLEQMHGTIEGLKNAWRNKVSHAQGRLTLLTADFSPDVAEEILFATRAFMRRLATDAPLPEGQPS